MNLAVKFYRDVDISEKPTGIPNSWPYKIVELGDSTDLPEGAWALMTCSEYQEYIRYRKPIYDAWYNAQPVEARSFVDP